ncbi:hypothetical protein [Streptomyces sp. BH104]|uniref:hypothetical protein n=1 Tax=Streptomyces sp. BH104 TaxID=3410407 RepID=UPI003BB74BC2
MSARLTPQREAEMTAGRRADLLVMLLHGGAATNSIATYVVDALVTAVRAERDEARAELVKRGLRAIHALKSPAPDGSQHYRSGWDDGLEAAIDAVREMVEGATS